MHTMKKLLALLLALCTVASFAACVGDVNTDPLDEPPANIGQKDEVSEEDKAPEESVPEGVTAKPKNINVFNNSSKTVVISGTCEENALVTAEGVGISTVQVNAKGNVFAIEVDLGDNVAVPVKLTAENKEEGKEKSDIVYVEVEDAQGEQGNLVTPVLLADRFVMFSENSLKVLNDTSVSYTDAETLTKSISSINLGDGDTELIYVLAPSRAKVLADKLPEDIKNSISTVSLYDQTVKALSDGGVQVIDLSEAFAAADKYPLFYDTHSGWTDYAAYIAYTEIMGYIDDKFPDAAARGEDEFDVNTVEDAYLGDLAYNLGMDIKLYCETVYDFVPKFDLGIGKEYAVNTQTPPVVEESVETSEELSGDDASADIEEEPEEEPEESVELDEDFLDTFSLIEDVRINVGDKDYRFYNQQFHGEYYDENEGEKPVLNDSEFCFGTNRLDEYLPSALIYRSSETAPIIPMLAERFRNSVFKAAGSYSVAATSAKEYAGTPENSNVDYIIVIVTEEELEKLYS